MRISCGLSWLGCLVFLACSGSDQPGTGAADAGAANAPDADPLRPDADPAAPDAAPVVADAGAPPDAGPPAPDAGPLPPAGTLTGPPYLMWVTQTEVTVRWETRSASVGRVDYGLADGRAETFGLSEVEGGAVTSHEVRLTSLTPGQLHNYRISFDGYSLPVSTVRAAPADSDASPFTFVVWGDNQNGPGTFDTISRLMAAEQPDFAFSVGDVVQNGTRREYRSQLFEPITQLADHVPFLVAAGNHERYSDSGAVLFEEYLSQPEDEHCFGWLWGDLYVVFLDTELEIPTPESPQGQCLTEALQSAEATGARFQAAAFHKPPRVEWWAGGSLAFTNEMEAPWVRNVVEPMLENLGVDIVFNGHNHLYAHTPATTGGITWVTTGGGGGAIDTSFGLWKVGTWSEIDTTIHEFHFLSVRVDGSVMTVRAIDESGAEMHRFTVTPN